MAAISFRSPRAETDSWKRLVKGCNEGSAAHAGQNEQNRVQIEESVRDQKRAKRALDAITRATGGVAYYPKSPAEVEEIAQQVAHELRNQYILAYTPTKPDDGAYRTIKVTAKGPRNPMVRTRSGYYAGKPSAIPK